VILAVGSPLGYVYAGPTLAQRVGGALSFGGVLLAIAIMLRLGMLNAAVSAVGGLLTVPLVRSRRAA